MSKVNKFFGYAQYTKEEFDKLRFTEKAGRLIFVRDIKEDGTIHSQIYFGTRLYAETNSTILNDRIDNIIEILGVQSSDGNLTLNFTTDNEIVGGSTNFVEAILKLETSILNLQKQIDEINKKLQIEISD